MEKINGWDTVTAFTGETVSLPAGLYKCVVKQVAVKNDTNGREQLVILFDINEGEHKGFYQKQFESRKQNNANANWGGVHKQHTHDKENGPNPWFKGMIGSIEKSNNGYRWDWNEKGLVGKQFGGIFGREEFLDNEGNKRMATKLVQFRSLDGLKDAVIPADKLLDSNSASGSATSPQPDANGFMNIPDGIAEELPFM